MIRSISFNSIKGLSKSYNLGRVTVLSGPNESGKSATIEALRLAVSGRASVGAKAQAQMKIAAKNASASAVGDGFSLTWRLENGKKQASGDDIQGGLPFTVEDFWSLTGAQRLALLVPSGSMEAMYGTIKELEAERKELNTVLKAPPIPRPDSYEGPPISEIESRLSQLREDIRMHEFEKQKASQAEGRERAEGLLEGAKRRYKDADEKEIQIGVLLQKYKAAVANQSRIVVRARQQQRPLRDVISDTTALIKEAATQSCTKEGDADLITGCLDKVVLAFPETVPPAIEGAIHGGMHIDQAHALALQEKASAMREVQELEARLNAEVAPPSDKLLSPDELMDKVVQIEDLEGQRRLASAWGNYTDLTKKQMLERDLASKRLDEVAEELKQAHEARDEIAVKLKGKVEDIANKMLEGVGLAPINLSVNATARSVSLDVSIGDIALEAMARSRGLLYGLCLLSAIHEVSSAVCPVLTAECAEMDHNTFDKVIRAMQQRTKGNVILEHWIKPETQCHLIEVGK